MGWLSGWAKRVKLTIDHNDIDSALSDFPILLYLSTSSGRNNDDISFVFDELQSDANRKKIAVTKSDGTTQCYVEIEKWDDANEKAWLWVKVPSVSNTADTDLYLYYDSSHADNTTYVGDPNSTPAENVWDSNFKFVCHMRDDPDTSHVRDSTSNNNDGTKQGAGEPAVTTSGQIADAQDFDGSNDRISLGSASSCGIPLCGQNKTAIAWFKLPAGSGRRAIMGWGADVNCGLFRCTVEDNGTLRIPPGGGCGAVGTTNSYEDNNWHLAAFIVDGDKGRINVDGGAEIVECDCSGWGNQDGTVYIGDEPAGHVFPGVIDEVRISNIARNAAWIKASYESGRDDLLDWGSQESLAKPRSFGFIIG